MKKHSIGIILMAIFGLLSRFGFTQEYQSYRINASGASGITFANGRLFAVQERNNKFLKLSSKGEILDSSIAIPKSQDVEDNEGICFFNNSLWTILEKSGKIINFSLKGDHIKSWNPSKKIDYKHPYGYESLTIDSVNKKLYLGHESVKIGTKNFSTIHAFSIDSNDSLIEDSKTYPIELLAEFRMTDFAFNSIDSCFYCIFSKYCKKDSTKSKYFISKMKLRNSVFLEVNSYDISSLMIVLVREGFNNNIEGITFDKDENLFLISDNHYRTKDKNTLLLSMKKSHLDTYPSTKIISPCP